MTKIVTAVLPLALLIFCFSVVGPAGSLRAATTTEDSTGAAPQYGDVNRDFSIDIFDLLAILRQMSGGEPATVHSDLDANGKTDIFDLLAILRLFGNMREPLEVAGTVGGHWLTEPVVYSWSQSWDSTEVRDQYQIYSNHGIDRAEFILDGDTLTEISGTTPVLFAADPDTVDVQSVNYMALSEPQIWKITIWDKLGNCVSDSGFSQFVSLYPGLLFEWHSNNVGKEIAFPLVLNGANQRFGLKVRNYYTGHYFVFNVDLNPTGSDSIVYNDIQQLANQIMAQIASDDSPFGSNPFLFVSAAVSRQTESITNRLLLHDTGTHHEAPGIVALYGNNNLIAQLGFKKWLQDIETITTDDNFYIDATVYEQYR